MPHLVPFVIVATLLTLTPGADTMVVLSHAARNDRHEAQRAGVIWLTVVARQAGAAKDRFGPRFRRITSAEGGVAQLGFGVRMALSDHELTGVRGLRLAS
jgi:threonine/homoserine/homoserine lactone efflux protein